MTCNMFDGATAGDFAQSEVSKLRKEFVALQVQAAELEQAMCGVCQALTAARIPVPPQLAVWFGRHRLKPGCEAP